MRSTRNKYIYTHTRTQTHTHACKVLKKKWLVIKLKKIMSLIFLIPMLENSYIRLYLKVSKNKLYLWNSCYTFFPKFVLCANNTGWKVQWNLDMQLFCWEAKCEGDLPAVRLVWGRSVESNWLPHWRPWSADHECVRSLKKSEADNNVRKTHAHTTHFRNRWDSFLV